MEFKKISLTNNDSKRREVYALVGGRGFLAVHPVVGNGYEWTLTHIKTGGAVFTFVTEMEAIRAMEKLEYLDGWENDNVADSKTNEELVKRVGKIIRESTPHF